RAGEQAGRENRKYVLPDGRIIATFDAARSKPLEQRRAEAALRGVCRALRREGGSGPGRRPGGASRRRLLEEPPGPVHPRRHRPRVPGPGPPGRRGYLAVLHPRDRLLEARAEAVVQALSRRAVEGLPRPRVSAEPRPARDLRGVGPPALCRV